MAKLMLVEDDNNLREIYEARLQAEGYEIVSAKDGEEALVLAKAEKPDLIISDVMMPKISGFEMLDILRNTEGLKQVKVIMLTALGQNDDQKLANRLGTDRYLIKSQVTLEDIVKVAHELLGDQAAAAGGSAPAAPGAEATAALQSPEATTPAAPQQAPDPNPAPDPAPEPPAPTPPTPAPEPPVTPDPTPPADTTVDNAQSEAQEEAAVDDKIENFVAGATAEPTPVTPTGDAAATSGSDSVAPASEPAVQPATEPIADSTATPTPDPNPAPTPAPEPPVTPDPASEPSAAPPTPDSQPTPELPATDPAATASDDKLVADAAQKLVDSTEEDKPPAAPPEDTAADAEPTETKLANSDDEDRRTKKIIKPLDTGPKQDLDTLLALEEAKEASGTVAPTPTPIVVTDSSEHAAAPPETQVIEPTPSEDTPSGAPASSAKPAVVTPTEPSDPSNIAL